MFQFYYQKTIGSLKHLGMAGFAAMLCVAFGVLSVYSLVALSSEIKSVFEVDPQVSLGGDVEVATTKPLGNDLRSEDLEEQFNLNFADLEGLEDYTLILNKNLPTYRVEGQSQASFGTYTIQGVNPDKFPLYGSYEYSPDQELAELLEVEGSVVVPRNFAQKNGLDVGSQIDLISDDNFETRRLTVTGLIDYAENKSSTTWFVSQETFLNRIDLGQRWVVLTAMLKGDEAELVRQIQGREPGSQLQTQELNQLQVYQTASTVNLIGDVIRQIFNVGLNGSSVLGLFVGGLGIATSVQIILRRRRQEIATLKSLGYQTGHVLGLLLAEIFVLSLVGSLLGLGLGILLSFWFFWAIQNAGGVFQISYSIQPLTALMAVASGILTSLSFTAITVWQNARVQPATVFRDFQSTKRLRSWLFNLLLLIPLLGVFFLIAAFLTESWMIGLGAVGLALVATLVSGSLFWLGFWLLTRLPLRLPGALNLSWLNLKQNFGRSVVAAVAIFAGTAILGFAMVIFDNVNDQLDNQRSDKSGWNLLVYAEQAQAESVERTIGELEEVNQTVSFSRTKVEVTQNDLTRSLILEGLNPEENIPNRDYEELTPQSGLLVDEIWQLGDETGSGWQTPFGPSQRAPDFFWDVGDDFEFQINGQRETLEVAGFFEPEPTPGFLQVPSPDLVLPSQQFTELVPEKARQTVFWLDSDPNNLVNNARQLSELDDSLLVYDAATLEQASLENYQNFVTFAVSLASLSLLAGLVLMINSILLSMIDRRREFGLLKAVGYSSSQVRNLVWFEYFLIGLAVALLAVVVDYVGVLAINAWEPAAELVYKPIYAVITAILALTIVLLATALSSWRALQTKPMEVLRYE